MCYVSLIVFLFCFIHCATSCILAYRLHLGNFVYFLIIYKTYSIGFFTNFIEIDLFVNASRMCRRYFYTLCKMEFLVIDEIFLSFVFVLYNNVRIYWLLSDKCFINRRDSVILFELFFLEIQVLIMANASRKYTDFREFIF